MTIDLTCEEHGVHDSFGERRDGKRDGRGGGGTAAVPEATASAALSVE